MQKEMMVPFTTPTTGRDRVGQLVCHHLHFDARLASKNWKSSRSANQARESGQTR